ncbi:hypothetical protein [Sagittula stellata]|uniref:Uncharacterized protein n=1 Tax=Sagittula stellata (strain ATCC 700073 / DSM 11524 / E-37) TaxID=388399 RepID=A3K9B5_SAGS3|nr:hypothetical protein [Sagittula stellata]EBA06287.1 hypothetical protein SSE37_15431 [Sagittula stellata E-37]
MKTVLKVLGGLVLVVALFAGAMFFFTSGSRDIARQFVTLSTTGGHDEARALLHPGLQDQLSTDKMAEMFAGAKPYEKVSFSSVSTGTGKPTTLEGTATTVDGCMSVLKFELLNEQIVGFDMSPLCR